jgi:5'-3' exonuclease
VAPHTVHLFDASPYIFRAFFSLPESLTDPAGNPVNAVYGFLGFLHRYLNEERPTHAAVAFDRSLTTSFRNDFHPGYKAGRALPPPALERQQDDCRAVAAALGFPVFDDARYEADDLIAALHAELRRAGERVVVVTSDKDLGQLVDAGTELYDFARGQRYDAAGIEARFGVRPDQLADYLGLAGDAVDDIPGVPGVGPKGAAALLSAFGTLDALYAQLDLVPNLPLRGARALAAKLAQGRELAFLSRRLATLAREAPARAELDALRLSPPERAQLEPLLRRLGFEGFLGRFPPAG